MTARDRILGRLRQAQQQKSNSIAMGGDVAAGKRHMPAAARHDRGRTIDAIHQRGTGTRLLCLSGEPQ